MLCKEMWPSSLHSAGPGGTEGEESSPRSGPDVASTHIPSSACHCVFMRWADLIMEIIVKSRPFGGKWRITVDRELQKLVCGLKSADSAGCSKYHVFS